ncbi:MATE family efflux transporter [Anaeromusa acidaminophila]|uniref:MATE family efflux transporter n=1 Tax=Anaeromusa acidaminophila TaxID=81464 RepID=UPI00036EE2D1|nr:MATE family efflux transporter [Anaeromusa acidaminophila]
MNKIHKNIRSNLVGSVWSAVMGMAFIPLYIKYLGIEAYGLIGIFALLQAWAVLLDMGLSQTLNREMARFCGGRYSVCDIRNLLCSIERVYMVIAVCLAAIVVALSEWLSVNWLHVDSLPISTVSQALSLSGVLLAVRWLGGLYRSGILGLQKQVIYNYYVLFFSTVKGAGVLGVLIWISPTIEAFFVFQSVVSIIEAWALRAVLYRSLPPNDTTDKFSWMSLRSVASFAGGVIGITFSAMLLAQTDKVLLSKWLSLTEFGYYTLAGISAGGIHYILTPVAAAVSPRIAEAVARGEYEEVKKTYHMYTQLLVFIILPVVMVLVFFSDHFLLVWTQNTEIANAVAPILSILALGNLFNGLMYIPYLTQLAYGWTSFTLIVNLVAVCFLVPAIYFFALWKGALGAAGAWLILNLFYVFCTLPIMHRKLLSGELASWYWKDVLPALLCMFALGGLGRFLLPNPMLETWEVSIAIIVIMGGSSLALGGAVLPEARDVMKKLLIIRKKE